MKRFYVFVRNKNGVGWTTNSFDTSKEAEHFAGLFKAEGREAHIKEMY